MNKHFYEGFEKNAGWIQRGVDKLKGLFTGKKYLYHGTGGANVESIMEKGILPGLESKYNIPGHAGKVFMTSNKDVARHYASHSKDGVVLRAAIPKEEFNKTRMEEIPSIPKQFAKFKGLEAFEQPIDSKHLKVVEKFDKNTAPKTLEKYRRHSSL